MERKPNIRNGMKNLRRLKRLEREQIQVEEVKEVEEVGLDGVEVGPMVTIFGRKPSKQALPS